MRGRVQRPPAGREPPDAGPIPWADPDDRDDGEVERRVETYRARYEAIRARARGERAAPDEATLFEPLAPGRGAGAAQRVEPRGGACAPRRDVPGCGGRIRAGRGVAAPSVRNAVPVRDALAGSVAAGQADAAAALDALRCASFLAGADQEAVADLLRRGRVVLRKAGQRLWVAGTRPREVAMALTGEARLVHLHADGREFVHRHAGRGACLGLVAALDGLPEPHDAEVTRTGTFLLVDRAEFLRFVDARPEVRTAVRVAVGRRYRRALRECRDVAFLPAAARVARFLAERACVRQADGARVLARVTNHEIGARVGVARESVSRAVTDLREDGVVLRSGRDVFVADWSALLAAARIDGADGVDPADTDRAESPLLRTRRFFAHAAEDAAGGALRDARVRCASVLGDLSTCRRLGCPLALAQPPDGS